MKLQYTLFGLLLVNTLTFAADIPGLDEGSATMNNEVCVSEEYQLCISTVCMTSEDIDCQEKCRDMAQDKCEQAQAE